MDENSPGSQCLGLSVMPVGRGTPYVPQTNKLGFATVQTTGLSVPSEINHVSLDLYQIQFMYYSTASFSQPYLYILSFLIYEFHYK